MGICQARLDFQIGLARLGEEFLPVLSTGAVAPEEELSALAAAYQSEVSENLIEKGVHIIENNVKILVNGSTCRFEVTLQTEESIKVETQGEQLIDCLLYTSRCV